MINKKYLFMFLAIASMGPLFIGFNLAVAQDSGGVDLSTIDDNVVIVVLGSAVGAALVVPLIGYATASKPGETPGKILDFNKAQYIRAVIIGIPSVATFAMSQIMIHNIELSNLATTLFLILQIFVDALAVDYTKSRIMKAKA